ncbi:AraC family transcriptional regulator [Musicola paradisiaca]|uniref:Transcriptional regulator, AraC family n=1 Tax=Musicola paradisiaca (strain Ech703) TaxID=579405 RepID=C6CDS4_MUSP7|nr:AraC family transcriptional regulator [Musicola paradisiaca]ACS85191.1 transcriptional regulator, AraC family [Musicola paradisiaca Ech703]
MHRISMNYIRILFNIIKYLKIDVNVLIAEANVSNLIIDKNNDYISMDEANKLFCSAVNISGDEYFGLKFYEFFHPSFFNVLSYMMMSSDNLLHALESACQFSTLVYSGSHPQMTRVDLNTYCFEFNDDHKLYNNENCLRYFHDAGISTLYAYCKWLTVGDFVRFSSVDFCYEKPANIEEYEALFGCPVQFGMGSSRMYFYADDLLKPLITKDEVLHRMHENHAQLKLKSEGVFTLKVRKVIEEQIKKGYCNVMSVSTSLYMTQRTLQRRLEDEGVYFKDILSDVKIELSRYYLIYSQCPLSHIADMVGYRDISSFSRACIRWFGMPPSFYRAENKKW